MRTLRNVGTSIALICNQGIFFAKTPRRMINDVMSKRDVNGDWRTNRNITEAIT